MPTTNQKQQRLLLLREIAERQNRYRYVEWLRCGDIDVDAIMSHQTIQRKIRSIEASRYLNGKRGPYRAGGAIAEMRRDLDDSPGCWLKPQEFKEKYGMLRESFWKLVEMIRHNPVFHRKKGSRGRKQVKPEFQLMVLLAFLRTEGSGMNNRKGRNLFSIGQGSVAKYRDRAVQAILEELYHDTVFWPDTEERKDISKRFVEKYPTFPNLVGIADGTLFPLAFRPQRSDFPDYHGRKHLYSLTCLIINDDKRRIRYFNAGWAGTTHDDRVFSNAAICKRSEQFFDPKQYLLGDSAYSPRPYVVSAFKKPIGGVIGRDRELFNTKMSKPRVTSEHTIGMLKGRWPFLRSIRFQLTEEKSTLETIIKYISVCVVLHNILIGFDDELEEYDWDDDISEIDADNELNQPLHPLACADARRTQLLNYMLENFD